MVRVQLDPPESALEGLASDPERFGRELRLAAATKVVPANPLKTD